MLPIGTIVQPLATNQQTNPVPFSFDGGKNELPIPRNFYLALSIFNGIVGGSQKATALVGIEIKMVNAHEYPAALAVHALALATLQNTCHKLAFLEELAMEEIREGKYTDVGSHAKEITEIRSDGRYIIEYAVLGIVNKLCTVHQVDLAKEIAHGYLPAGQCATKAAAVINTCAAGVETRESQAESLRQMLESIPKSPTERIRSLAQEGRFDEAITRARQLPDVDEEACVEGIEGFENKDTAIGKIAIEMAKVGRGGEGIALVLGHRKDLITTFLLTTLLTEIIEEGVTLVRSPEEIAAVEVAIPTYDARLQATLKATLNRQKGKITLINDAIKCACGKAKLEFDRELCKRAIRMEENGEFKSQFDTYFGQPSEQRVTVVSFIGAKLLLELGLLIEAISLAENIQDINWRSEIFHKAISKMTDEREFDRLRDVVAKIECQDSRDDLYLKMIERLLEWV